MAARNCSAESDGTSSLHAADTLNEQDGCQVIGASGSPMTMCVRYGTPINGEPRAEP